MTRFHARSQPETGGDCGKPFSHSQLLPNEQTTNQSKAGALIWRGVPTRWVEQETKKREMQTNVVGLKASSVQMERRVEDVNSSLSGLSDRNLALSHTTLACYYTPPLPPCVRALISMGDPDTADRMTHEGGWMGRQRRFHVPKTARCFT